MKHNGNKKCDHCSPPADSILETPSDAQRMCGIQMCERKLNLMARDGFHWRDTWLFVSTCWWCMSDRGVNWLNSALCSGGTHHKHSHEPYDYFANMRVANNEIPLEKTTRLFHANYGCARTTAHDMELLIFPVFDPFAQKRNWATKNERAPKDGRNIWSSDSMGVGQKVSGERVSDAAIGFIEASLCTTSAGRLKCIHLCANWRWNTHLGGNV